MATSRTCATFRAAAFAAAMTIFAAGTTAAEETLNVGLFYTVSDLPMLIALDQGYFEEEGITLDLTSFKSGAQMMAPLGTGQLDVGATIISAGLFNLASRDVNLTVVSDRGSQRPGFGYYRLLVRKELVDNGSFKSMADLKGLRLGTQSKGGGAEVTLNEALKKGGLTFDDVTVSYLGHSDMVAGLANGAVDAGFVTEPNASIAINNGSAVEVATGDQVDPNGILGIMAFDAALLNDRPETARGFLRAFVRGCRFVNDAYKDGVLQEEFKAPVVAVYNNHFKIADDELIAGMKPSGCNPDGVPDQGSIDKQYAFFKERGYLEGNPDPAILFDFSLVKDVVAELGPYIPKN